MGKLVRFNVSYIETAVPKLLRLPEVIAKTRLSRSTVYRLMSEGCFPRHFKIGQAAVVWDAAELDRWIECKRAGDA